MIHCISLGILCSPRLMLTTAPENQPPISELEGCDSDGALCRHSYCQWMSVRVLSNITTW
jgi:hypothetical protein